MSAHLCGLQNQLLRGFTVSLHHTFMSKFNTAFFLVALFCGVVISTVNSGCAQVGSPTGGPRDSTAPKLVRANPEYGATNFDGKNITLTFDEYIDVQDIQSNVQTSPLQKINPVVKAGLNTISIRLKDTLRPNTTYSIDFGNAIKDVNEGNVYKNLTYVFSTGNYIDSLTIQGRALLAETGEADSTLKAYLYRTKNDTAVLAQKPDYIANVDGSGNFRFKNLPGDAFYLYVLTDGDGGKTYNSTSEMFGFTNGNKPVSSLTPDSTILLYAFKKPAKDLPPPVTRPATNPRDRGNAAENKLRYTFAAKDNTQDILQPVEIVFTNALAQADSAGIYITDTNYNRIPGQRITLDSTAKIVSIEKQLSQGEPYFLMLRQDLIKDSAGATIFKSDTLKFAAKRTEDYGSVVLRFANLKLNQKPVLQLLQGQTVKNTYPLASAEWSLNMILPGEYSFRILYDTNGNGVWDPGDFRKNIQPEISVFIPEKIGVRRNFENESEITLRQ